MSKQGAMNRIPPRIIRYVGLPSSAVRERNASGLQEIADSTKDDGPYDAYLHAIVAFYRCRWIVRVSRQRPSLVLDPDDAPSRSNNVTTGSNDLSCVTSTVIHCDAECNCRCLRDLKPPVNGTCPPVLTFSINRNAPPKEVKPTHYHPVDNTTVSTLTVTKSNDSILFALSISLPVAFFAFLILAALLSMRMYARRKKRRQRPAQNAQRLAENAHLMEQMNTVQKNPSYFSPDVERPRSVKSIPIDQINIHESIGEGAFGQVFKGALIDGEAGNKPIAIKVLKEGASREVKEDFDREVHIMSSFDHENILRLIGVVWDDAAGSGTPYMVFEYMIHGDLADLLRRNDPAMRAIDEEAIVQKHDLVEIATQVAAGMVYLAEQHFVHRDLATRNCLVGSDLIVKISDFGMSRDVYTCDYYKVGGSRMLPVRWMAPESLKYGRFTTESDVWSYGVVLWEIFSFGRQPYYGNSNDEVVRFLDEGVLLCKPDDCERDIYHLMTSCWKRDPKDRWNFEYILSYLKNYHRQTIEDAGEQTSKSFENVIYST